MFATAGELVTHPRGLTLICSNVIEKVITPTRTSFLPQTRDANKEFVCLKTDKHVKSFESRLPCDADIPVSRWRDEVQAAVDSVVGHRPAVHPGLCIQEVLAFTVDVVYNWLPAGETSDGNTRRIDEEIG